jgi:hypothetical protein
MPAKSPLQYELWADLSVQNRHLRRNNALHWCVHLLLVVAFLLVAGRPPVAIRIDQLGRADMVSTSGALALAPSAEEAQHVTRLFAQYVLEVTSGSVARDLGKALALMTSDFQRAYREKLREDPSLAVIDKGNIRTALTFDDGGTEVRVQKDKGGKPERYFVTQLARLDVFRADLNTAPLLSREVVIRSTLLVVPRGPRSLNGLLVDFFEKEIAEPTRTQSAVNVNPLPVRTHSAPPSTR